MMINVKGLAVAILVAGVMVRAGTANAQSQMTSVSPPPAVISVTPQLLNAVADLSSTAKDVVKSILAEQIKSEKNTQDQLNRKLVLAARTLTPLERGRIGEEFNKSVERASVARDSISVLDGAPLINPHRLRKVTETIQSMSRPLWVLCEGKPWIDINAKSPSAGDLEGWSYAVEPFIKKYRDRMNSVGRIEVYDIHAGTERYRAAVGTAFVIKRNILLTARHVVEQFARIDGERALIYSDNSARFNVGAEYSRCNPKRSNTSYLIEKVLKVGVGEGADWALLQVEANDTLNPLDLANALENVHSGEKVALIGYPDEPVFDVNRLSQQQIEWLFKAPDGSDAQFLVKRLSPGRVKEGSSLEDEISYDANAFGGNSGSAVFRLHDGAVIGLHYGSYVNSAGAVSYNKAIGSEQLAVAVREILASLR